MSKVPAYTVLAAQLCQCIQYKTFFMPLKKKSPGNVLGEESLQAVNEQRSCCFCVVGGFPTSPSLTKPQFYSINREVFTFVSRAGSCITDCFK